MNLFIVNYLDSEQTDQLFNYERNQLRFHINGKKAK